MATATPGSRPVLKGARILILEDHRDTREMYASNLRAMGAKVFEAATAQVALLTVQREQPDVLLVDLELPDVDGYQFVKAVRQLAAEQGGRIPAVAFTVHNQPEDRARVLSAGFQLHVPKPADPQELARLIGGLLQLKD